MYSKMGKKPQAIATLQQGLALVDDYCDIGMVFELTSCLHGLENSVDASASGPEQVEHMATVDQQKAQPLVDAEARTLPPSPPPLDVEEQSFFSVEVTPPPGPDSTEKVTLRLQLALLRSHFIGEENMPMGASASSEDSRIHPKLIASAKQSLAHASGEDLVDDLIAVGYLLVNSSSLVEACELFQLLLSYRCELS